ncbi:Hypothetical predicted protein [Paramuricea clavata]|uniref:Uncharacterized protein n=1 Tax=Paramuricea clavata TaxID=317549 RepID=A0A6S7K5N6_PARCT|nr:Hypothetical predicted protein [Paramuricea clavata]
MLFKFLIVLHSFVLLASAKECKSGQNCELRCCTIPAGDVLCRERCLGLSCELDVHCDGDCCVNSICSSCLLKRLSLRGSSRVHNSTQPTSNKRSTTSFVTTDEPKVPTEAKTTNREDRVKVTRNTSPTRLHPSGCLAVQCLSECCIDGRCVDSSQCVPVKAARGGRGGGGRRGGGRRRVGGGGYFGNGSGQGGHPVKSWQISLIVGVSLIMVVPMN